MRCTKVLSDSTLKEGSSCSVGSVVDSSVCSVGLTRTYTEMLAEAEGSANERFKVSAQRPTALVGDEAAANKALEVDRARDIADGVFVVRVDFFLEAPPWPWFGVELIRPPMVAYLGLLRDDFFPGVFPDRIVGCCFGGWCWECWWWVGGGWRVVVVGMCLALKMSK